MLEGMQHHVERISFGGIAVPLPVLPALNGEGEKMRINYNGIAMMTRIFGDHRTRTAEIQKDGRKVFSRPTSISFKNMLEHPVTAFGCKQLGLLGVRA
jgi:hypothetical protein